MRFIVVWSLIAKILFAVTLTGLSFVGGECFAFDYWLWGQRMQSTWFDAMENQSLSREAQWEKANATAPRDLSLPENERPFLLSRLELEFNPPAIERAIADLQENWGDEFTLPENFQSRFEKYQAIRPLVVDYLKTGEIPTALAELYHTEKVTENPHRAIVALIEAMFALQKETLLGNPLLDFDELLVLDRQMPTTHWGLDYWSWGVRYGATVNWSCDFRPKNPPAHPELVNSLIAVSLTKKGDSSQSRTVFTPPTGQMLQHPELGFDADRILFSMGDSDGAFQLFETNIDGSNLRRITRDTPNDVDNGDGCYLPDGQIVFNSTRSFIGVPCEDGRSYVSNLCKCDSAGNNTRMLTFDQESNWHPSLLNNGRVLYTRYEYANIGHQFGRLLFHMNPDGTNQSEFYGSNSYWPNSVFFARAIPNHPTQVVGVVCGHHGPNKTGRLLLFDPALGRHETTGAVQTIPGYGQPVERVVEDTLYSMDWPKFSHPYPLSDHYFLVSARVSHDQDEYGIYLVDIFDNMTEIYRVKGHSLFEPIPIAHRERPAIIPDRVDLDSNEATVLLTDVYFGRGMEGVPRGTIKKLRVFSYNYLYRDMLECGFEHLATPGIDGPWEPRFLLGEVPVEENGSAFFKIPANLPISIQPIDENGEAIQQMRSWFVGMPGEVVSCIGCHEEQNSVPPTLSEIAATKAPSTIEPWKGPPRGFDYSREVQPVLDRYCVGCHDSTHPLALDFTRKSLSETVEISHRYQQLSESVIATIFTPSYISLHQYVRRPQAESCLGLQYPAEFRVNTSLLFKLLRQGHHGVTLDNESWERLITWIDLGAPDHGSWKNTVWNTPKNHYLRRLENFKQFANRDIDVEWLPAPTTEKIDFQHPQSVTSSKQSLQPANASDGKSWSFSKEDAKMKQSQSDLPQTMTLTVAPNVTIDCVLIPAGDYVIQRENGREKSSASFSVTIDKPFYMSVAEITNEQYKSLTNSNHNSGFLSWLSIDMRGEGYPLYFDKQPVVRVSQLEATLFCRQLSELSGRNVQLPTELQWEWAARAGTDTPFWFGTVDSNFGEYENLAGTEMVDLAFIAKPPWFLRDLQFSDQQLISASVKSFRPNFWGLYDMIGNASEWTRSDFADNLLEANGDIEGASSAPHSQETNPLTEKMVCGGNWSLRPTDATVAQRRSYPAWQKVNDVGFRIVVEIPAGL